MRKHSVLFICVIVFLTFLCSGCGKTQKYNIASDDGSTYKITLKQGESLPKLNDWEMPQKDGCVFCGIYGEKRMKMSGSSQYSVYEDRLYDSALKPVQALAIEYDRLYFRWVPETVRLTEDNLMNFFDFEYEATVTETIYDDNGIRIPGMIQAELTLSPKESWHFNGSVNIGAEVLMRYNIIPGVSGSGDTITKEVEFLLEESGDFTQTITVDMIDPAYLSTYSYDISISKLTSVEGEMSLEDISDDILKEAAEMKLEE